MSEIRDSLAQVQELLGRATPGPWSICGQSTGHACTCGLVWGAGDHSPAVAEFSLSDEEYEGHRPSAEERQFNTEATVAAVNFLRAHSAEIAGALRDAERLDWMIGNCAVLETNGYGDWRIKYYWTSPITYGPYADAPRSAIDSAMQQGGGGGE